MCCDRISETDLQGLIEACIVYSSRSSHLERPTSNGNSQTQARTQKQETGNVNSSTDLLYICLSPAPSRADKRCQSASYTKMTKRKQSVCSYTPSHPERLSHHAYRSYMLQIPHSYRIRLRLFMALSVFLFQSLFHRNHIQRIEVISFPLPMSGPA